MFSYRALRSLQSKHRPPSARYQYGELYVNLGDHQLGVIDQDGNPQDLLAITHFSEDAQYTQGDHVIYQGDIYIANKDITTPGNFDPADWNTSGVDLSVADYDQGKTYTKGSTAFFPNFGCFLTAKVDIPANEAYDRTKWEFPCSADPADPGLPDKPGGGGYEIGDIVTLPYTPDIAELSDRQLIICQGQLLNVAGTYADLFAVYGFKYGQNASQTQFRLPDFRGYALRGVDESKAVDPDADTRTGSGTNRGAMGGTHQGDMLGSHSHTVRLGEPENDYVNAPGSVTGFSKHKIYNWYGHHTALASGGKETRMKNIGVHFFAQY